MKQRQKILDKFGGKRITTYQGEDITPLWDLKGEGIPWKIGRNTLKLCDE